MNDYIGIDISKASLQVYIPKSNIDIEVANTKDGLKKLISKLKKLYGKTVNNLIWIYEPTGSYWTLIKRYCHENAISCFIVKPSQSAAFAKTIKNRNKTDIVDARMLYRMHTIASKENINIPSYDKAQEQLQNHIRYYKSLVRERVVKTNQLEASLAREDEVFIIRKLRSKIKALKKEEKEIIEKMLSLIAFTPKYQKQLESITSFKGVGNLSGIVLLEFFMRYKDANAKEITALAGLDPIEISSGSSIHKKSRISKQGSKLIRNTLFMGTMISIQYNKEMRTFYDRLKARGKHTTSAQIAIMRKIVMITFSLYKSGTIYDEKRYEKWNNVKRAS
jgi:transposase